MMKLMNETVPITDSLIGALAGYRCPDCGCCLFVNSLNSVWCSECRFIADNQDVTVFTRLPIPDDHWFWSWQAEDGER